MENIRLSVVLPVFNEEGNLDELHRRIRGGDRSGGLVFRPDPEVDHQIVRTVITIDGIGTLVVTHFTRQRRGYDAGYDIAPVIGMQNGKRREIDIVGRRFVSRTLELDG